MKIRIEGHVTPERLIAALEEVATQYIAILGDQFGGFYGATLDLKAFTCAGQPASFNRRKTELKITVGSMPPDGIAMPSLDRRRSYRMSSNCLLFWATAAGDVETVLPSICHRISAEAKVPGFAPASMHQWPRA
ncbi:hypothetical protein, partial [Paraburkholderia tropica]